MIYLKMFFAVAVWGAALAFTKKAVGEISPLTLVTLRCFFGTAVLLVLCGGVGWLKNFSRRDLGRALAAGVFGVVAVQLMQAWALTLTSAGHTGWLVGSMPIAIIALAAIFLGERIGKLRSAGFGLGFLGVLFVVSAKWEFAAGAGDAIFILSTFAWAAYVILMNTWFRDYPTMKITALNMIFSLALLVPFSLAAGGAGELKELSLKGWGCVFYLGILSSGVCYYFWNEGVKKLGPSSAAAFLYLEPFSAQVAALALGEKFSPRAVFGGLLILAGVYWVNGGRRGSRTLRKIYCTIAGC